MIDRAEESRQTCKDGGSLCFLEEMKGFKAGQAGPNREIDLRADSGAGWLPDMGYLDKQRKPLFQLVADDGKAASEKPEKHSMSSRIFSWGWTFDIQGPNGENEGVIDQKIFNLKKTFEYSDANGQKQALGQSRLFSWGTKIDVSDADGNNIGGIQENVFQSLWRPYTTYSIVDKDGKEIAKSEKVQFFATDFTLKNNNGEKIATIHRPWLNFLRDNWDITILKPNEVDKRLLYMIPAYKTSADAERRAQESKSSDDSK